MKCLLCILAVLYTLISLGQTDSLEVRNAKKAPKYPRTMLYDIHQGRCFCVPYYNAHFPGGEYAFEKLVKDNVQLPSYFKRRNAQVTVTVNSIINENGNFIRSNVVCDSLNYKWGKKIIYNAKETKALYSIQNQILRLIDTCKIFCTPAHIWSNSTTSLLTHKVSINKDRYKKGKPPKETYTRSDTFTINEQPAKPLVDISALTDSIEKYVEKPDCFAHCDLVWLFTLEVDTTGAITDYIFPSAYLFIEGERGRPDSNDDFYREYNYWVEDIYNYVKANLRYTPASINGQHKFEKTTPIICLSRDCF